MQIIYTPGEEVQYLAEIEQLDNNELRQFFRSRREEALRISKKLAIAFTALAVSEIQDVDEEEGGASLETDDAGSSFDTTEEESLFGETDGEGCDSEYDDDASSVEDEDISEEFEDDSMTDPDGDGDDSTYTDGSPSEGDDEDSTSSVLEDVSTLKDLHTLMKELLEHNSQLCLIQLILDNRDGKENVGPSLIRAMVPWALGSEDRRDIDRLLTLETLSLR